MPIGLADDHFTAECAAVVVGRGYGNVHDLVGQCAGRGWRTDLDLAARFHHARDPDDLRAGRNACVAVSSYSPGLNLSARRRSLAVNGLEDDHPARQRLAVQRDAAPYVGPIRGVQPLDKTIPRATGL